MPTQTTNMQMTKPLTSEMADVVVINGNMDKVDAHRHIGGTDGLAVKAVQAGPLGARPGPSVAGQLYFATDTGRLHFDTGSAWVEVPGNGNVSTAMLATNAVTQLASNSVTDVQATTTNSLAAIPNSSVTLTTTGGDVLVIASLSVSNSIVGYLTSYGLGQDGGFLFLGRVVFTQGGYEQQVSLVNRWTAPAAGTHTYAIGWATAGGTLANDPNVARSIVAMEVKR